MSEPVVRVQPTVDADGFVEMRASDNGGYVSYAAYADLLAKLPTKPEPPAFIDFTPGAQDD